MVDNRAETVEVKDKDQTPNYEKVYSDLIDKEEDRHQRLYPSWAIELY
jgi:hypothetical protein